MGCEFEPCFDFTLKTPHKVMTIGAEGNGEPPHKIYFTRKNSELSLVSATPKIKHATEFLVSELNEIFCKRFQVLLNKDLAF